MAMVVSFAATDARFAYGDCGDMTNLGRRVVATIPSSEVSPDRKFEVHRQQGVEWTPVDWRITPRGQPYELLAGDRVAGGEEPNGVIVSVCGRGDIVVHYRAKYEFDEAPTDPESIGTLLEGLLYAFLTVPSKIRTPQLVAANQKTVYVLSTDESRTLLTVVAGEVRCANEYLEAGIVATTSETIEARTGAAPVKIQDIDVKLLNAVRWAFRYPPILDLDAYAAVLASATPEEQRAWDRLHEGDVVLEDQLPATYRWQSALLLSFARARARDWAAAITALEALGDRLPPLGRLRLAELYLAVGRIDAAKTVLDGLSDAPAELRALRDAQRAVVALVRGDVVAARGLAAASRAGGGGTGAVLAESLVAQAEGDISRARDLAQIASQSRSSSSLVRLAELELGSGNATAAAGLAAEAERLDAHDARAVATSGFCRLALLDRAGARAMFERAIRMDETDALSHFGLGLALVADGDLEEGIRVLEHAVYLEPRNAPFHSYLAKALLEADRYDEAAGHLALAKALDRDDPTPYLYESFLAVARRQPVAALRSLEESIERNDFRTVYRSRLLLDQDRAVRAAGLGHVFGRLGFFEAAGVEAVRSLNDDYAASEAHLLLADRYRTEGNGSPTRFAETVIASTYAPVSVNTFNRLAGVEAKQPSRLFSGGTSGGGDAGSASLAGFVAQQPSYNEYTTLVGDAVGRTFVRSAVDTERTLAARLTRTGGLGRAAYSLAYDSIVGLEVGDGLGRVEGSVAAQLHPAVNALSVTEAIALPQPSGSRRIAERAAARWRVAPWGDFAAQGVYRDESFEGEGDATRRGDLQLVTRGTFSTVLGASWDDAEVRFTRTSDLPHRARRAYSYLTWHLERWPGIPTPTLAVRAGLSYVHLKDAVHDSAQGFTVRRTVATSFPGREFGLFWDPSHDVTFRAGYSRLLTQTTFGDFFSLQPTTNMGFETLAFGEKIIDVEQESAAIDWRRRGRDYAGVEVRYLLRRFKQLRDDFDPPRHETAAHLYWSHVFNDIAVATLRYRHRHFTDTMDDAVLLDARQLFPNGLLVVTSVGWSRTDNVVRNVNESASDAALAASDTPIGIFIGYQFLGRTGVVGIGGANLATTAPAGFLRADLSF